jgi:PKD repeat protein
VAFVNCSDPGSGLDFAWDFGDDSTSTDFEPEHTYAEAGDYTVTLIASNKCGVDTVSHDISVSLEPVAMLFFKPDSVYVPPQSAGVSTAIALRIEDAEGVMGIEAAIQFDASKVDVGQFDPGDFLAKTGGVVTDLSSFDEGTGVLTVNLAAAGGVPAGVTGDGVVMCIVLDALVENPTSDIRFLSTSLRDSLNEEIPVGTIDTGITGVGCLLGDFIVDWEVDFEDFTRFVYYWNQNPDDARGDIAREREEGEPSPGPGPWTCTNYPYCCDGVIDFEDLMVFAIMYNWDRSVPYCVNPSVLIAAPAPANPQANLAFQTSDAALVGSDVTVRLSLDDAGGIMGFHVGLEYDEALLRYVGHKLERDGSGEGVFVPSLERVDGDRVDLSLAVLRGSAPGGVDEFTLDLLFEALDCGTALIEVEDLDLRTFENSVVAIDPRDYPGGKSIEITGPDSEPRPVFSLKQNSPNPFGSGTAISYSLGTPSHVSLRVYDTAGRLVVVLVDQALDTGRHRAAWNGTDKHGAEVASGVYFYRLQAGDYTATRRMVVSR